MSARSKKRGGGGVAPLSDALQECYEILRFLQTREDSQPFLEPVDWQAYGLTDYPEIIQHPMDLGTIQTRLEGGQYKDPSAFASDVRLVWDNCAKYNRPDSDLYMTADKLSKLFEKKFVKLKGASSASSSSSAQPSSSSSSKKSSSSTASSSVLPDQATRADRLKLCQLVNQLTPEQLGSLVEMIQGQCPEALNEEEEEEIEIEVNNIDGPTLQTLIQFANQCVNGSDSNKKQKTK